MISSSFSNRATSHNIANRLAAGRDRIKVSTKPGNYFISSLFFLSALFWDFLMLAIFFSKNYVLESNSKYVLKDTDFTYLHITHLLFFRQINCGLIFLTFLIILIRLSHSFNIFENFEYFFSFRFYYLNVIFDIEYFIDSSQVSELPLVFNSVTSIESRSNHLLYFMGFMQLNSSKDATYS